MKFRCLLFCSIVLPIIAFSQSITYTGPTSFCSGGSITLTASINPQNSTFQWQKDGNPIPTAVVSSYTATTSGSYGVLVTAAGTTVAYTPVTVVVNPNPIADYTFSPDGDCANQPITFTNSSTGNTLTYAWDFNDPNSGTGNTSTTTSPVRAFTGTAGNSTQTFNVKLTVTDANGCIASKTSIITKKQIPSDTLVEAGGSKIYNNQIYFTNCSQTTALFTFYNSSNTTKPTNTNYLISWGNGNPDYNSATFPSAGITQTYNTGSYTINYTVSGSNGCLATQAYYVFVGSNPAGNIVSPGNTNLLCTGDAVTFPILNTGSNPPSTVYKITFSDDNSTVTYNHPAPASVTHTYLINSCNISGNTFTASSNFSNACATTPAVLSSIFVSDKPVASFTTSSNSVCVNSTVTVNSNASKNTTVLNGICTAGKVVWIITPSSGFTITNGGLSALGDDNNGSSATATWTGGSTSLNIRFTVSGTYTIKLRSGSGNTNCGADETTKTICVNAIPTAAFTVDQNTGCNNLAVKTTNTSSAATCGTNTYAWTVGYSSTSGCLPNTSNVTYNSGNATSVTPEFNFINPGTYTIGLTTSSSGGCSSSQATQSIVVKSKPTVAINAASSICVGSFTPTATVGNCNSSTAATYAWSFSGGSPASSTNAAPGAISYATPGTYTIGLVVTNECGSTTVSQSITVNPIPTVTVPANLIKCAGNTTGNLIFTGSLSGTTYIWSNTTSSIGLATSGSGSTISSFTVTNAGITPLISIISVTPSVGGCSGPSGSFSITVNPKPGSPVVITPVTYCLNATAIPLTATSASGNTLTWYNNSSLTGGSPSIPTPSTGSAGTTNYYVTQDNSYPCTSNAATIAVTVTPLITNNTISADQTLCAGTSAATLTGTTPAGGNGNGTYSYQWLSSTDGGTTWNNLTGSTSSTYNPGILNSTTSFKRNVTSGACILPSINVVNITIQATLSNTGISANQDVCEGNTISLITGQIPTGGSGSYTYQWDSSLNNSTWITMVGATSKDYQPPALSNTAYYRRKITSGSCSATSSSVKITIYNIPKAGTVSPSVINSCFGSNISLSTSGFVGTIKKWQYNLTPGNTNTWVDTLVTNSSINFNNVQNNFGVRVIVIQLGPCTNQDTSSTVLVNVSNSTNAGTTASDATVCTGGNSGTINLTGQTGNVLRWETSTNNGINWSSVANTITSINYNNLTVTTWYRAVVQSGACAQSNSNVTKITVVQTVTTANAGVDQQLCNQNIITLNGNNPSIGTGNWSQTGGPAATIVNPSLRNTQITGIQSSQTYKFLWSITGSGSCPSSSDEVQITNTPSISKAVVGPAQSICNFVTKDSINLTGNAPGNPSFETGNWSFILPNPVGSAPVIRNTNNPTSQFIFDKAGTYQLIWTISNGVCVSTKDTILINVYNKSVAGTLNASATSACIGNDVLISSGSLVSGTIDKWQYNITPTNPLTWVDSLVSTTSISFKNVQQSFTARLVVKSNGFSAGCTLSDTSSISITVIPDFSNSIDTSSVAICSGQTVSITGQVPSGGNGNYIYQWQQSSDGIAWTNLIGETSISLNISPLNSFYYHRVVTVSPCIKTSLPAYVYVRPLAGNFLMSDSLGTCFPFSVTFTNLVLPSSLTTWSFGDGAFNQGDQVTHTYSTTGSFQVKMTSQYPGGCKFESIKTVNITGPTGVFVYDHDKNCTSVPALFQVSSSNIDSVRWNFGDGQSAVTTEKVVYHQFSQPGTFIPSAELLAGTNGFCKTKITGPDTLFVDEIKSGFKITAIQECSVTHVSFTDTARAFFGIKSYSWNFADATTSIDRNPYHDYYISKIRNIRQIVTGNTGCTDTTNFPLSVLVWDIPQVKTNGDTAACVGQIINYTASVFASDAIQSTVWNFSNGAGATTLKYPKAYTFPGTYMAIFVASTVNGCADTARLPITIYSVPVVNLGPDRTLSTGTLLPLNTLVTNGPISTWDWSPSTDLNCSTCPLPTAYIKNDISYILNATDIHGCSASDTINIKVFCESSQIFIPNVFTPDNDGLNDILMVRGTGIRTIKYFRIFNRWGEVVFERSNFSPNDKSNGWDGRIRGTMAPPDVYVYTCEAVCENGYSFTYRGNTSIVK